MMNKKLLQRSQRKYNGRRALIYSTPVVRPATRDCSKLTIEELQFLALTPGNADCEEELNRRFDNIGVNNDK